MSNPGTFGLSPTLGPSGGASTFSGARMVGDGNDAGTGAVVELPTNTGSGDFGADSVSAISYDTGAYTTGHGLADCRFVVPSDGYYRINASVGWQYFTPSAREGRFNTSLVIDGDWGVPDPTPPPLLKRVRDQFRFPLRDDDSQTEFHVASLEMTEALDAGAEVWLKGGFDAIPSSVGDSAWAGIISFEIERVG